MFFFTEKNLHMIFHRICVNEKHNKRFFSQLFIKIMIKLDFLKNQDNQISPLNKRPEMTFFQQLNFVRFFADGKRRGVFVVREGEKNGGTL